MRIVIWEGNSLDVLRKFPDRIKESLGYNLERLQRGLLPFDSKPIHSIGSAVFELRDRDERGGYRLIYYTQVHDRIYVLHVFEKRSWKTPKEALHTARIRLKRVLERFRQERR